MAVTVTKENFAELVLGSNRKVMLDFWAPWCTPCKMVGPIVEQIAEERQDVLVGKVDVDSQPELARQFRVMSIPTILVLVQGEVVQRSVGYRPKDALLALLDKE